MQIQLCVYSATYLCSNRLPGEPPKESHVGPAMLAGHGMLRGVLGAPDPVAPRAPGLPLTAHTLTHTHTSPWPACKGTHGHRGCCGGVPGNAMARITLGSSHCSPSTRQSQRQDAALSGWGTGIRPRSCAITPWSAADTSSCTSPAPQRSFCRGLMEKSLKMRTPSDRHPL